VSEDLLESLEDRIEFLRRKVEREGLDVPDEVIEYLADRGKTAQGLKGALLKAHALASIAHRPIDMQIARASVGEAEPEVIAELVAPLEPDVIVEVDVVLDVEPQLDAMFEREPELATAPHEDAPAPEPAPTEAAPTAPAPVAPAPTAQQAPATLFGGFDEPEPARSPVATVPETVPAVVYFAPMRTTTKKSLVVRAGQLLDRAGLAGAIAEDDLVAVKLHFGERGNTGFVQPIFVREIVHRVKQAGGKPFLTDANTLYRGQRFNAVDHLGCAIHNGFAYATVEAPLIIADGLDGRDAVDVPIVGGKHFESVRIGSAAVHADAMVVVTHVKGHEATGFGGALKNVGMGLGSRSAKQRMHSDFTPEVAAEKCTACRRCVEWCPVNAITIGPDRVAVVDFELCYGCGECVASCPYSAIATQWKTTPEAIQEKIAEHVAGAVAGKEGKVVYLSFLTNISPDCDCWNFSDAAVVPDIGVLASTDPIAIDQAAYDLVKAAVGLAGSRGDGMAPGEDKFARITGIDGTVAMAYGEQLGLGTRSYEIVEIR